MTHTRKSMAITSILIISTLIFCVIATFEIWKLYDTKEAEAKILSFMGRKFHKQFVIDLHSYNWGDILEIGITHEVNLHVKDHLSEKIHVEYTDGATYFVVDQTINGTLTTSFMFDPLLMRNKYADN